MDIICYSKICILTPSFIPFLELLFLSKFLSGIIYLPEELPVAALPFAVQVCWQCIRSAFVFSEKKKLLLLLTDFFFPEHESILFFNSLRMSLPYLLSCIVSDKKSPINFNFVSLPVMCLWL